ncbi:hypothetical protein VVT58_10225 [Sphingobium sp. SJ10-10]|uniref:hypothetical protein n=1 Tax=Sphingobium sp. SJ10-10 TaxID=3114999 RepID=UPI002E19E4AE|nr:hypothetical protein [Sphingobium sp. SJ10-10]
MFVWFVIVAWLTLNHVPWRDEVRSLSFANHGETLADMIQGVRGDGHPLLWYLLLRGGHGLIGSLALPVIAFLVALAAVAVLIWRSPFTPVIKTMIVLSHFALWDYAVMARNYGISMLLMFVFAAGYSRWRDRGYWLMIPLVLLANTNVHSTLLSWLLLAVWISDRYPGRSLRVRWIERMVMPTVVLLAIASLACFLTVWPPANDAAVYQKHRDMVSIMKALALPGYGFLVTSKFGLWAQLPLTAVLYASLFIVRNRVAYFLAAWVGLAGMSLFFTILHPGFERHIALWLLFLITLYWMDLDQNFFAPVEERSGKATQWGKIGRVGLYLLLSAELIMAEVAIMAQFKYPHSRARDAATLIAQNPALADAIIIADPDIMIEALPYYAPRNSVYRIREDALGPLIRFTSIGARLHISLDYVTDTAIRLHHSFHRPVVILMQRTPVPGQSMTYNTGYNWTTSYTPAMTRRFYANTQLIGALGPAVTDESYSVYLLRD